MLTRRNWMELTGAAGLALAAKGHLEGQAIEHGARSALDEEHARKRRYGSAEDVAQDTTLARSVFRIPCRFRFHPPHYLILSGPLKPALTRETSIRKPGDLGETTYRAGRSSSAPLLPHRCYAPRKSLEFRSRGPWPPVGGTGSHV